MDRRSFLQTACLGAATVVVGNAMIDLNGVATLKAASRSSSTAQIKEIPLRIEDTPDLKPVGGAYHLEIEDMGKNILVAHVSNDKYVAVDMKCTHKGCDIEYKKDEKVFGCPCHGSEFSLAGVPTKGPAKTALASYIVTVTDEEIIIHVPAEGETPPPTTPPTGVVPTRDTLNKPMPVR
jgi:Rieske Fe-S protein